MSPAAAVVLVPLVSGGRGVDPAPPPAAHERHDLGDRLGGEGSGDPPWRRQQHDGCAQDCGRPPPHRPADRRHADGGAEGRRRERRAADHVAGEQAGGEPAGGAATLSTAAAAPAARRAVAAGRPAHSTLARFDLVPPKGGGDKGGWGSRPFCSSFFSCATFRTFFPVSIPHTSKATRSSE